MTKKWLTENQTENPPIEGEEKEGVVNTTEPIQCLVVVLNSDPIIGKILSEFWEEIIKEKYQ